MNVIGGIMTSRKEVDKAKEQYEKTILEFLTERGWKCNLNKLYPWTKWVEGRYMQAKDTSEAYSWEEE
jgi:hypothetical protein